MKDILAPVIFCKMLSQNIDEDVKLGRPDKAIPGVYVWPYFMRTNTSLRNSSLNVEEVKDYSYSPMIIEVLIIVETTVETERLKKLEKINQVIHNNPIIIEESTKIKITQKENSLENLSNIFSAACIPLSVCIGFELSYLKR